MTVAWTTRSILISQVCAVGSKSLVKIDTGSKNLKPGSFAQQTSLLVIKVGRPPTTQTCQVHKGLWGDPLSSTRPGKRPASGSDTDTNIGLDRMGPISSKNHQHIKKNKTE